MSTKNINSDDKKIKKTEFYKNKKVFQIDDIDAYKITKNAFKYIIGYKTIVIRPLCLGFPQMTGYAKKFNENVTMFFRVNNKELLKNYNMGKN